MGVGGHLLLHRGSAEVLAVLAVVTGAVGDDGDGVGPVLDAAKVVDLGQGRVGGQAGWLLGQHRGLPLAAQGLLLGEGLLFPAHLAAGCAACLAGALATQEVEARATWCSRRMRVAVGVGNLGQCGVVGRAFFGGGDIWLGGSRVAGHGGARAAASRYDRGRVISKEQEVGWRSSSRARR